MYTIGESSEDLQRAVKTAKFSVLVTTTTLMYETLRSCDASNSTLIQ